MQATTPVDPRVLDAMLPHYTQQFGNPHSRTHFYGWENEDAVEDARDVRNLIVLWKFAEQAYCRWKRLLFVRSIIMPLHALLEVEVRCFVVKLMADMSDDAMLCVLETGRFD